MPSPPPFEDEEVDRTVADLSILPPGGLSPEQKTDPNAARGTDPAQPAPGLARPPPLRPPLGRTPTTAEHTPVDPLAGMPVTAEHTPVRQPPHGVFTPAAPMPAFPQSEAAQGERFGKYRLAGALNAGGMAEVFVALQGGMEGFSKVVALKRILPQIAESPEFIEMFLDEARLAALLDHPNIVRIYDLGSIDGRYFISMEYLPGEDLSQVVRAARRAQQLISPDVAASLIQAAADGLHYAHDLTDENGHAMGVVHRDVNPSNIFLTYHGQVKVLDFGIAKASTNAGGTQQGTLKGKLGYVSPEQVRGQPADRRSDVFGLGIVLWELLAGRRLFHRETDAATLMAVVNGDTPPLTEFRKDVDPGLEGIALRALAKDPLQRFPTARAVYDALDRWFMHRARPSPNQLAAFLTSLFGELRAGAKLAIARGSNLRTNIRIVMKPPQEPAGTMGDLQPRATPAPAQAEPPRKEEAARKEEPVFTEDLPRPAPAPAPALPPALAAALARARAGASRLLEWLRDQELLRDRRVQLGGAAAGGVLILTLGASALLGQPEEPVAAPAPAAAAGDSTLTLESDPAGAFIFLAGEPTGRFTPATLEGLPTGKELKIRLEKAGFAPVVESVSLPPSGTVVKRLVLRPMSGRLVFRNVPPGGKVMVDGRPVQGQADLAVGDHLVQLVLDGRFKFSRNVNVRPGQQSFTFPDR